MTPPAPHAIDHDRRIRWAVFAIGLAPTLWFAWLLWLAPVEGLTADRTALAARDFTALWAAGRAAREHAFSLLTDPERFTAYLRAMFGSGMPDQIWPYPPTMLLLAGPLAGMPLGPAFAVYTALSLAALAALLRNLDVSPAGTAAILFSPAVACNALAGQNGAVTATLLVGGLSMIDRRPAIAGLLLGALCIKPQMALLIPICLLAGRRWRSLFAGCVSACSLALSSMLIFGYEPWVEFLTRNRSTITQYAEAPWHAEPAQTLFSSAFMAARSIGLGLTESYAFQTLVTTGSAWLLWRLWSSPATDPDRRLATTLALVLLAAPWVHVYDLPALAVAIGLLLPRTCGPQRALLGFAWLWPGLFASAPAAPLLSLLSVASVAWAAAGLPRTAWRPQHSA